MQTFKYSDVTTLIQKAFPKGIIDDNAAIIANIATNKIWMAYDWRESIVKLPPIWIQPLKQDILPPPTIVPADFAGLREVKIKKTDGCYFIDRPLILTKNLEVTEVQGIPSSITYLQENRGIRLHPVPTSEFRAPNYFLSGIYKKLPVKITSTTLNTLLPFDDLYFQVWLETMRWASYSLLGDQRAGGTNGSSNQKYVNGQLAICEAAIDAMASDQGINSGEVMNSPLEPIWTGYNGGNYYL